MRMSFAAVVAAVFVCGMTLAFGGLGTDAAAQHAPCNPAVQSCP
jgi:hypothetical protein